jgi:cation:H+ antiporter
MVASLVNESSIIFTRKFTYLGNLLFIVLGLVLLIAGGNWLLKSAVALSLRLFIPKIVIGMTVVSFATSAPELIVSIKAALDGFPDLSLGNVVGSNIANLGLVLAITVIMGSIDVRKSFYTTDWPVMIVASLLFCGFIYFDGVLEQYEGIILVSFLFVFLVYLLRFQKTAVVDEMPEDDVPLPLYKIVLFLGIGGTALWGGSELLIDGAVGMASSFGVSDRVIGITIVSVGTSIPELAASVIAVIKKEKAISLGNLIGSNIFNLLAVLGITSIITPITVMDEGLLSSDIFWMLGISFLILPLVFFPKGLRLGWRDGLVLLAFYVTFIYMTIK